MLLYNWTKTAELAIKEQDALLASILLRKPFYLSYALSQQLESLIEAHHKEKLL